MIMFFRKQNSVKDEFYFVIEDYYYQKMVNFKKTQINSFIAQHNREEQIIQNQANKFGCSF